MRRDDPSWRQVIPQELSGPAITPIAQRRRRFVWLRRVLTTVVVMAVVLGGGYAGYYLYTHSTTLAPYAQTQARTQLRFFSDGQLTARWFEDNYPDIRTRGLLSIDIAALQAALLRHPQVLEATVQREFPGTLRVNLRERQAIGRIKLKQNGATSIFYVARDGHMFTSAEYRPSANLPYIAGARVQQIGGGLAPLGGMLTLADILDGLKARFHDIYLQISLIDLADWDFPVGPQTSVVLKTRAGTRLRFGPEGVEAQLDRLADTLALMASEKQSLGNVLIDMTYPDKVAIIGGSGK